jgi:hypothetical protein
MDETDNNRRRSTVDARRALARVNLTFDAGSIDSHGSDDTGRHTRIGARPVPFLQSELASPVGHLPARLAEVITAYLGAVRVMGRAPATVDMYRSALACFLSWIDGYRPQATCADLDHVLADAYVHYLRHGYRAWVTGRGLRLSDCSVHQYATVLKSFARWGAHGRRYWSVSPLADYETPTFTEHEIVPCTQEKIGALLGACGPETTFVGRRLRAMLPGRPGHRRAPGEAAPTHAPDDRPGRWTAEGIGQSQQAAGGATGAKVITTLSDPPASDMLA